MFKNINRTNKSLDNGNTCCYTKVVELLLLSFFAYHALTSGVNNTFHLRTPGHDSTITYTSHLQRNRNIFNRWIDIQIHLDILYPKESMFARASETMCDKKRKKSFAQRLHKYFGQISVTCLVQLIFCTKGIIIILRCVAFHLRYFGSKRI